MHLDNRASVGVSFCCVIASARMKMVLYSEKFTSFFTAHFYAWDVCCVSIHRCSQRSDIKAISFVLTYCVYFIAQWLFIWSRAIYAKLIVAQLLRNFPSYLEPEGSLPCIKDFSTGSYHESDESSPPYILKVHFIIILPSTSFKRSSTHILWPKFVRIFHIPMRAMHPARLFLICLVKLYQMKSIHFWGGWISSYKLSSVFTCKLRIRKVVA
jgi:hypothetical protein